MAQLAERAAALQPAQLPLVLWACASLGHRPTPGVLTALEGQARASSSQLSAQVWRRMLLCTASHPCTSVVAKQTEGAHPPGTNSC